MKIFLFLLTGFFMWQTQDLAAVRKMYQTANNNKAAATAFIQSVAEYSGNDATMRAYKAAAITLQAKHEKKLALKKELFVKGAKQLEDIIDKNPNLLELRMIRLSIQENTPRLMKYKGHIDEDKNKILSQYAQQSTEIKKTIKAFVQVSASFTAAEKSKLQ